MGNVKFLDTFFVNVFFQKKSVLAPFAKNLVEYSGVEVVIWTTILKQFKSAVFAIVEKVGKTIAGGCLHNATEIL